MLTCHDINKSYDGKTVLGGVSFAVDRGERVGLVGDNGCGKSTLLKIILGEVEPDGGHAEIDTGASVAYVGQELTAAENGLSGTAWLGDGTAAGASPQALGLMRRLGLPLETLNREVGSLSGGEKTKLGLVRACLRPSDLYLLDEPTNNLDLSGIAWLEDFIRRSRAAFLIVSHDRRLLDNLTTKTVAIDWYTRKAATYGMPFSEYREARAAAVRGQFEDYADYRGEVRRLKDAATRKKEWARQGSGSPKSTDNDKSLRERRRERSSGAGGAAKAIERNLTRLQAVERPQERLPMKLSFGDTERSGDLVFECREATVERGGSTWGPVNLEVRYGDRVALVGPNGGGKTTLIKLLSGELTPTSGETRRGTRLAIGYLAQETTFDSAKSVLEQFRGETKTDEGLFRRTLNRFGLGADDMGKRAADLSPGQRSRLVLARLMENEVNCLLLDEPTNHLDLEALEAIEAGLADFKGTVVVATHDRYFLDVLQPTRTLLVEPGGVVRPIGSYHELESSKTRGES
jgi:ATPase subunit of ABC transporter with duplicated ATPase domains